jgi:hypothetical protein
MPKLSWPAFVDRHPAAHLVAGIIPEGDPVATNSRWALNLVGKLIARLAPTSLYALSIQRQGRTPEVHCVFEKDNRCAQASERGSGRSRGLLPRLAKPAHIHVRYRGLPANRGGPQGALGHGGPIEKTNAAEIPGHADSGATATRDAADQSPPGS